ncbi:MAG: hypothetical protein ACETWK_10740 [Candidatus Aminicenantaceae bacterium]
MERTELPELTRKRPDTAIPLFLRSPRLSSTLLSGLPQIRWDRLAQR